MRCAAAVNRGYMYFVHWALLDGNQRLLAIWTPRSHEASKHLIPPSPAFPFFVARISVVSFILSSSPVKAAWVSSVPYEPCSSRDAAHPRREPWLHHLSHKVDHKRVCQSISDPPEMGWRKCWESLIFLVPFPYFFFLFVV